MKRTLLLISIAFVSTLLHAQATVVQKGKPFSRSVKGATGDLFSIMDGVFSEDGKHVLQVEEGVMQKVVRLDANLVPSEELALKDVLLEGVKWNGVAPIVVNGTMHCLLVSNSKKGADYGIGTIDTKGKLAITGFHKVASFEIPYVNNPGNTLAVRPMPDPILFTKGLAYAQEERIVKGSDGSYLLNHFTQDGKGNKRFFYAYLDKDFTALWNGSVELPYEDAKSTIHQILLSPNGTIRLLTYVYQCKSDGQMGDKNCHELHLTTLTEKGKTATDLLLEKDFVGSARILEHHKG
ncbi:MAG TPA: hypothetical protein PK760_07725, partial [Flavobacteriales bacterium]|nr:hypothetical protein [Flavobacteriales bacterium]